MPQRTRGFTLVEIMIVVVIIGLLAAMAIPAISRVREKARVNRFANDLRVFASGLDTMMLELGTTPGDPSSGSFAGGHAQLGEYLNEGVYSQPTSLGGVWDIDSGDFGYRAVVGVDFGGSPTADQTKMLQAVDDLIDDGDLTTGTFQAFDGGRRGYAVIE